MHFIITSKQYYNVMHKDINIVIYIRTSSYDNMGIMDDTNVSGMYPSRPFRWSQAKDLQGLQAMFMKREA